VKRTAKGWGIPDRVGISRENVDVGVCGVCTCRWRREHCCRDRRCVRLFGSGGEQGRIAILKELMGDEFPPDWGRSDLWRKSMTQVRLRDEKIAEFEREAYRKCRPLRVEVRTA